MARGIRDYFIHILAREGGEKAVRYFVNGWVYPTQSDIEAAHNRAVREIIEGKMFRALPPLERLALLCGWLQPASQKMPHNARELCPGYAEAEDAHRWAVEQALRELSRDEVNLLRDVLRWRAYRLWALEKEPQAVIQAEAGEYVVLLWRDSFDAWWAGVFPAGSKLEDLYREALAVSPAYLQAGHLSSRRIRLRASYRVDARNRPVIAVVVEHSLRCDRQDCPLPAATEFLRTGYGWQGVPWRVNVSVEQALLPPVGERRVRQGDMVFCLMQLDPQVNPNELPGSDAPEWADSHHVIEGLIRWARLGDEVVGIVQREVRISHQEHPEARVWIYSGSVEPFLLRAYPVCGKTQYVPRPRLD